MLPLSAWPLEHRCKIIGVFTDIDDTLTTDGAITADALQALHDLKAAGLHVVAITGRPVGWSQEFALNWPVDAIVAENGAVALRARSEQKNHIHLPVIGEKISSFPTPILDSLLLKTYQSEPWIREHNYARMQQVLARIEREVPGAQRSTDSVGRETDIAIDHSEFTHLPPERIAQVVHIMQSEGMNATVSSIHINAWFGDHNKLQGARWIVRQLFDRDLDAEIDRWAYIGDSTNDQLMFEAFTHSVGVANIAQFVPQLAHLPRYVTVGERGAGFRQFCDALLTPA
jgi:hydroxymethylpyrimidine pyrophosphatase-like HAD family hydrolase